MTTATIAPLDPGSSVFERWIEPAFLEAYAFGGLIYALRLGINSKGTPLVYVTVRPQTGLLAKADPYYLTALPDLATARRFIWTEASGPQGMEVANAA